MESVYKSDLIKAAKQADVFVRKQQRVGLLPHNKMNFKIGKLSGLLTSTIFKFHRNKDLPFSEHD